MNKVKSYSSVLAVSDLDQSLSFYVEKLGFHQDSSYGDPPYVADIHRNETECLSLLCLPDAKVGGNGIATLVFRCDGIDSLYEEMLEKGVPMDESIGDKEYGMREFRVKDPDDYILYFQERIHPAAD